MMNKEPSCPLFGGFKISIPSTGLPEGFYVPPDKSYRIVPPVGWEIIPEGDGTVRFQSRIPAEGYWPGMFIAKEPADGSRLQEAEIDTVVAKDREAFRFASGESLDLPFGRAYVAIYEHTFQGLRIKTAEAHFVCDGVRYWAPFNALATTFDRHFPTYLNCLKTFAPLQPHGNWN